MDAATLATHGAGFLLGTACLHAAGFALCAAFTPLRTRAAARAPRHASRAVRIRWFREKPEPHWRSRTIHRKVAAPKITPGSS
jgi:hypothetical protein